MHGGCTIYRVTSMGFGASWVQAISEASFSAIAATGLAIAGHQIRATNRNTETARRNTETARKMAEVDRTLELHRDFSMGSVGEARWRFIALMHFLGERSGGKGKCFQPTWDQLRPPVGGHTEDPANVRGSLARYDIAVSDRWQNAEPLHDLYTVLYYFKRVLGAVHNQAIDPELLRELMGVHVEWWYVLCGKLTKEDSVLVAPLLDLADYEWGEPLSQRVRLYEQFFNTKEPVREVNPGVLPEDRKPLPTRKS